MGDGSQGKRRASSSRRSALHAAPPRWRISGCPLRAGSDILFLGGLIHYALENELYFRDYVVNYTNAAVIIPEDFKDTEDLDGVFSGWNDEKKSYDPKTWIYEGAAPHGTSTTQHTARTDAHGGHAQHGQNLTPDLAATSTIPRCNIPRCVFQLLRKHFARYTPEMVEHYCGVSKDAFLHAAKTYCTASGPEKTGAICYALGWTQHSSGVQMIRCAAILQLLLGNIGRPGGGIMALRGHASIQGSTDIPTLYDILPGYLNMPKFGDESKTLANYHREVQAPHRLVEQFRQIHRQPPEILLRRSRAARKRFRLQLAAARHRRSFPSGLLARHARRKNGRPFRHGPESRRRRTQFRHGAPRA